MCVAYMKIQPGIATQVSSLFFLTIKTTFCVGINVTCIMTLLWIANVISESSHCLWVKCLFVCLQYS